MIVYHGTDSESAQNIVKHGIDLSFGDESVDNAQGFYTTPSRDFAIRRAKSMTERAKRFQQDSSLRPALVEIEYCLPDSENLFVKRFDDVSLEWEEFVFYNRLGRRFLKSNKITSKNHNLDFKYDVVIDETADSKIGELVSKVRYKETRGSASIKSFIENADISPPPSWGKQISFHSKNAIKCCIKSMRVVYV